jgi:hypothetical protein
MSGFENATTDVLLITRGRLLQGLELVAKHVADGSFHTVGPKGEAPPSQAGQLTRIFLEEIGKELARRQTADLSVTGPTIRAA